VNISHFWGKNPAKSNAVFIGHWLQIYLITYKKNTLKEY